MKLIFLFLILLGTALAQVPGVCDYSGWVQCIKDVDLFGQTTCAPMVTRAPRYHSECLCYKAASTVRCYYLCTTNATLTKEYQSNILPQQQSLCAAVNLDPRNLPQPPSWQVDGFNNQTTTNATGGGNTDGQSVNASFMSFPLWIMISSCLFASM